MDEQMYIIVSSCWKCDSALNVAVISDPANPGDFRGPITFSIEEIKLAEENDVIIKEHNSWTREEKYNANTCPSCNTFIGEHYLFASHFTPALYGDLEFKTVSLSSNEG